MREHGILPSSEPAKRALIGLRCYDRGSTCHAPKGAAARCCSVVALGRARKERLWYVAPFLLTDQQWAPFFQAVPRSSTPTTSNGEQVRDPNHRQPAGPTPHGARWVGLAA